MRISIKKLKALIKETMKRIESSQADFDMAHEWCSENLPDDISDEEFNAKVAEVASEIANDDNMPMRGIDKMISMHR